MNNRYAKVILAIAALCVLGPGQALAYVLPPSFIAKLYARAHEKQKLSDLTLDLEVAATIPGEEGGERSIEGRLYFKKDAGLRLIIGEDNKNKTLLVEKAGRRTVARLTPELSILPKEDLLSDLFATFGKDEDEIGDAIIAKCKSLGIDTAAVSLKRHGSEVVYVVGALPTEEKKPQIWFTKEENLPIYYRFNAKGFDEKDHAYEIWLREYGAAETGNWFPGELAIKRDGQQVLLLRVTKASKNTDLPDTLFSSLAGG